VVLIPNLLFQVENKCAIIKEGERILKPSGQLLIVDRAGEIASLKEIKIMAPPTDCLSPIGEEAIITGLKKGATPKPAATPQATPEATATPSPTPTATP